MGKPIFKEACACILPGDRDTMAVGTQIMPRFEILIQVQVVYWIDGSTPDVKLEINPRGTNVLPS